MAASTGTIRERNMELTDNILWLLKQASHFSLTTVNEAISGHGVTTAQIGLMRQLANEPGLSGAELARRLLISPQGVQLALAALERRGLVERKQDPQHGRIMQAYLTDEGRAVTTAVLADAPGPPGSRPTRSLRTRAYSACSPPKNNNCCTTCWPALSRRAPDTPFSPSTPTRKPADHPSMSST